MSTYADFDGGRPRDACDHTAVWNRLTPIGDASEDVRAAINEFCERKRITFGALEALGTRVIKNPAVYRSPVGLCLAYAGMNGNGRVIAIKYRPIGGTSHDSRAEEPSFWQHPIVIGNRNSLDWLTLEGETDSARLFDLVGDQCAILVLPAGALAFRAEWAAQIPRGATVRLCHDADEQGDRGAEKAAPIIGGRTVRVRPPIEGGDWCDWDGDREAFLRLAQAESRYSFTTYKDFAALNLPVAEPLLGGPGKVLLATGSLLMVYGREGSGKTTWTIDGIVHLAAGQPWLGFSVPRAVRALIIENEGPPGLFQQKLATKLTTWDGPDPSPNLSVYANPWGEFSFADPDARAALRDYCEQHQIDLVTANPTLGLGVGTSGKPDETKQFVDWLIECGLWRDRAFWLNHHQNKQGQISGDWGRHPDMKVLLERDGNRQRTKLTWDKPRWANLEPHERCVMLDWITDGQGYAVVPLDSVAVSDEELDERINEYLVAHPATSTRQVQEHVKGSNARISARLTKRFDHIPGPRGAKLWLPLATATATSGGAVGADG